MIRLSLVYIKGGCPKVHLYFFVPELTYCPVTTEFSIDKDSTSPLRIFLDTNTVLEMMENPSRPFTFSKILDLSKRKKFTVQNGFVLYITYTVKQVRPVRSLM